MSDPKCYRIECGNEKGTGFQFDKYKPNLILTVKHVVAGAIENPNKPIYVWIGDEKREFCIKNEKLSLDAKDIAVILEPKDNVSLTKPEDIYCDTMELEDGSSVRAIGFYHGRNDGPSHHQFTSIHKIGPQKYSCTNEDNLVCVERSNYSFTAATDADYSGLSGAPVICDLEVNRQQVSRLVGILSCQKQGDLTRLWGLCGEEFYEELYNLKYPLHIQERELDIIWLVKQVSNKVKPAYFGECLDRMESNTKGLVCEYETLLKNGDIYEDEKGFLINGDSSEKRVEKYESFSRDKKYYLQTILRYFRQQLLQLLQHIDEETPKCEEKRNTIPTEIVFRDDELAEACADSYVAYPEYLNHHKTNISYQLSEALILFDDAIDEAWYLGRQERDYLEYLKQAGEYLQKAYAHITEGDKKQQAIKDVFAAKYAMLLPQMLSPKGEHDSLLLDRAISFLETDLGHDYEFPQRYLYLSRMYYEIDNYEKACQYAKDALNCCPSTYFNCLADSYNWLGHAQNKLEDLNNALLNWSIAREKRKKTNKSSMALLIDDATHLIPHEIRREDFRAAIRSAEDIFECRKQIKSGCSENERDELEELLKEDNERIYECCLEAAAHGVDCTENVLKCIQAGLSKDTPAILAINYYMNYVRSFQNNKNVIAKTSNKLEDICKIGEKLKYIPKGSIYQIPARYILINDLLKLKKQRYDSLGVHIAEHYKTLGYDVFDPLDESGHGTYVGINLKDKPCWMFFVSPAMKQDITWEEHLDTAVKVCQNESIPILFAIFHTKEEYEKLKEGFMSEEKECTTHFTGEDNRRNFLSGYMDYRDDSNPGVEVFRLLLNEDELAPPLESIV